MLNDKVTVKTDTIPVTELVIDKSKFESIIDKLRDDLENNRIDLKDVIIFDSLGCVDLE